jgi:hypothetical protein
MEVLKNTFTTPKGEEEDGIL